MAICDSSGSLAKLTDSLDSLRTAWADTATSWDDSTSRRFYRERLEPLEPIARKALGAIQRLAEVLARVEAECGDT